jgi:hypothetical protein
MRIRITDAMAPDVRAAFMSVEGELTALRSMINGAAEMAPATLVLPSSKPSNPKTPCVVVSSDGSKIEVWSTSQGRWMYATLS